MTTESPEGSLRLGYDRLGREMARARRLFDGTFDASETTTEFDEVGRVAKVDGPYGETSFQYDDLGRLTHERRPDGSARAGEKAQRVSIYSDFWESTTIDDQLGSSTTRTDGVGLVQETRELDDGGDVSTTYQWRPFGLLGRVVHPAGGGETVMKYDRLGRRFEITTPDTGATLTFFNAFGETRDEIDAQSRTATYRYDLLGRLVRKETLSTTIETTVFTMDAAPSGLGALARAVSPDGVVTENAYDADFGSLRRTDLYVPGVNNGKALSTSRAFDSRGRPEILTYPSTGSVGAPLAVKHVYAANGELRSVLNASTDSLFWEATAREPLGRVSAETFGNGANSTRTYFPDTGRLRRIQTGPNGTLQNLEYAYFGTGELRRRSDFAQGQHEGFKYDKLGRLQEWFESDDQGLPRAGGWNTAYQYDPRGNLRHRIVSGGETPPQDVEQVYGGTAGGKNRLESSTLWKNQGVPIKFGYDLVGNVTNHPGVGTIEYTPFNLPRRTASAQSGAPSLEYLYDAFETRASKKWSGSNGDIQTTYMGRLYERRKEGGETVHVMYVYCDTRMIAQISRPEPSGQDQTTYVYSDHLDSAELLHAQNGSVTRRKRDPFGNRLALVSGRIDPTIGAASPTAGGLGDVSRGFSGHEEDAELGLVNMGGRTYDPRLGRLLQADPIVQAPFFSQSHNRYVYVFNNPLMLVDPSGFEAETPDPNCDVVYACVHVVDKASPPPLTAAQQAFLNSDITRFQDMNIPLNDDRSDAGDPFVSELLDPVNWIPGGSLIDARNDLKNERYGWAAFNIILAVADLASAGLGKVATAPLKAVIKAEARAGAKAGINAARVRNIEVRHASRKEALEAATHAHGGKPRPTPSKTDGAARREYDEAQKYRSPERHPDSDHPDSHFHDSNKTEAKERHGVNRHHTW